MKFLELFEPIKKGDFALTEEAIYKSIGLGNKMIPLWGGNQNHDIAERYVDENGKTKENKSITLFNGEGIIISLDGSAGSMTYKKGGRFALNHHAGFFTAKRNPEYYIDLEFFSIFYSEQLKEASISEGSKTLALKKLYSSNFDIPSREIQERLMLQLKTIKSKIQNINRLHRKIELIENKIFSHNYKKFQVKDAKVSKIFSYVSGNSGLTEEKIYQKILLTGEKFEVLSGATLLNRRLGIVSKFNINGKALKTFENNEGLLVVRKGKAGHTTFLKKGNYTLTDDAYILFLKNDCKYEISLQWFQIQYAKSFLEFASSTDNSTWNMTGFFKYVKIDIPDISEQIEITKRYEELNSLKDRFSKIDTKLKSLIVKFSFE